MPPPAPRARTAISTVGVVAWPQSMTSIPMLCRVAAVSAETTAPDGRPSRPMTTVGVAPERSSQSANPATLLTMSSGVRFVPGDPPIVPRNPEILLIRGMQGWFKDRRR